MVQPSIDEPTARRVYGSGVMRASAILLAVISATGCIQPAFTQSDGMDTLASCRVTESCGEGGKSSDLVLPIVLGTALVGVVALAMHRYVIADDD